MNRQNRRLLKLMRILVDAGLFIVLGDVLVLQSSSLTITGVMLLVGGSGVWIVLMAWQRVYSDTAVLKFSTHLSVVLGASVLTSLLGLGAMSLWLSIRISWEPLVLFTISLVMGETLIIAVTRRLMVAGVKRGTFGIGIALVGITPLTAEYAQAVKSNLRFGHVLRAVLGEAQSDLTELVPTGSIGDLETVLRNDPLITQVVIGIPTTHYAQLPVLLDICDRRGVGVSLIPDAQRYLSARPAIDTIGNIALMSPMQSPLDFIARRAIKRAFDVVFSLSVLIVGAPVFLGIALLVKLSSPGPILFVQERIGRYNRPFKLLKFRSMRVIDHEGAWSAKAESRITPIGHFLRKFSLDELPQFINVLVGDMSVVGPRPERPQFVERFSTEIPKYRLKHRVKPGITGLAQVNGCRGDTSIPLRIQYDLTYIESWSFLLDLTIIARTVLLGFINRSES